MPHDISPSFIEIQLLIESAGGKIIMNKSFA